MTQKGNQGDKETAEINLKVAHRDVRVTAGPWQRPRTNGGFLPNHLDFARKIASRSQTLLARWPRLQQTFRQNLVHPAGSPIHQHWNQSINLAPRLNLTLLGLTTDGAGISDRPQTADRRPLTWQPVRRTAAWRPVEQLLQRVRVRDLELFGDIRETIGLQSQVIRRGRHVESGQSKLGTQTIYRTLSVQTAPALGPANHPAPPPVPRVLRRSRQEGGAEDQAFRASQSDSPSPFKAQASGFGPSPPNSPPIDMNQLTNHVMQAIDRRLLAYRERTGRV